MRERSGIWWLNPAIVFAASAVSIAVAAYAISESTYRIYWRTPKFFDQSALGATLLSAAVFVFGYFCGSKLVSSPPRRRVDQPSDELPFDLLLTLFRWSFYLCLLGYALWVGFAIERGITLSFVSDVVRGEKGAMYEARFTYLPTVGGVTTLTQFGTALVILAAVIGFRRGWREVWPKCAIVLALAVMRALLNSERFAIIELVVPFIVAALGVGSGRFRILIRIAPFAGVFALFFLFTAFEYFRSWTNYYAGRDLSLWEFGAMRLIGYYVTSFNNGAYLLQRLATLGAPYFTLHFLWGFPLSGPLVRQLFPNPMLDASDKWFYFPFLESGANVEFNNADGMLFPMMDFGFAGGLLYWFLTAAAIGAAYELFRREKLAGLLVYPILYLGLIEAPLALYWGEGRAFPSLCLLIGVPALLGLLKERKQAHDQHRTERAFLRA